MRLKWILFWFILAAVLVARIAIEQGKEYASLFGIALTAAVALAAMRLVDQFLLAWVLLAVCWWCTWKLTWDCTLIDDNADACGEGLLQAAGFREESPPASTPAGNDVAAENTEVEKIEAEQPTPSNRRASGRCMLRANGSSTFPWRHCRSSGSGSCSFHLATPRARAYGFSLLALYVASALGLLLTTSFLGLRRYLRQRKLQMPAAMTRAWLVTGTVIALALLCSGTALTPAARGVFGHGARRQNRQQAP